MSYLSTSLGFLSGIYTTLKSNIPHLTSMNKLRRERSDDNQHQRFQQFRPLRIIASGTLFLKHAISVPCHPIPASEIRAHSVEKVRGGSANIVRGTAPLANDALTTLVVRSFLCSLSFPP